MSSCDGTNGDSEATVDVVEAGESSGDGGDVGRDAGGGTLEGDIRDMLAVYIASSCLLEAPVMKLRDIKSLR